MSEAGPAVARTVVAESELEGDPGRGAHDEDDAQDLD